MALLLRVGAPLPTCHSFSLRRSIHLTHGFHMNSGTSEHHPPLLIPTRQRSLVAFVVVVGQNLSPPHRRPAEKQRGDQSKARGLCGGIRRSNLGHRGRTPVQRAASATWRLPANGYCLCLPVAPPPPHPPFHWCGGLMSEWMMKPKHEHQSRPA